MLGFFSLRTKGREGNILKKHQSYRVCVRYYFLSLFPIISNLSSWDSYSFLILSPASKNYMVFTFEEASPVLRHTDSNLLCGARYPSDLARGWIMCLCCLIFLQPLNSAAVDHCVPCSVHSKIAYSNYLQLLCHVFFSIYLSLSQDLKIPVSSSSICGM